MTRLDENLEYVKASKNKRNLSSVPAQKHKGGRASKPWAGLTAPRPKRINKDGKWVQYGDYLRGAHWARKRKEALNFWGHQCLLCGQKSPPLQVHHTHYDDLWNEDVADLRIYCGKCHAAQGG